MSHNDNLNGLNQQFGKPLPFLWQYPHLPFFNSLQLVLLDSTKRVEPSVCLNPQKLVRLAKTTTVGSFGWMTCRSSDMMALFAVT